MSLSLISDPEEIREAPGLVYLTVDWSCPERESRRCFYEAVERLSKEHAALGICYASLDEEAAPTRALLSSLGFNTTYARGAGSLLWLEAGRQVGYAILGRLLGAEGIIARTLSLWDG